MGVAFRPQAATRLDSLAKPQKDILFFCLPVGGPVPQAIFAQFSLRRAPPRRRREQRGALQSLRRLRPAKKQSKDYPGRSHPRAEARPAEPGFSITGRRALNPVLAFSSPGICTVRRLRLFVVSRLHHRIDPGAEQGEVKPHRIVGISLAERRGDLLDGPPVVLTPGEKPQGPPHFARMNVER